MEKTTLGLVAVALMLGTAGVSASTTFAYKGDPAVKGPNYSIERHTSIIKAFENNDYTAWKALMSDRGRVTKVINKDNFAKFVEAHRLTLEGKKDEVQKIRQELGLGLKNGSGKGYGNRLCR